LNFMQPFRAFSKNLRPRAKHTAAFSLILNLLRWERKQPSYGPVFSDDRPTNPAAPIFKGLDAILPLPAGEGRGVGEPCSLTRWLRFYLNRSMFYVLPLALVLLTSCSPPVFVERLFQPGELLELEWQATGNPQQLWLDVRTVGGRSLRGPVTVYSAEQQVAQGTFSLANRGIREHNWINVRNWVSTPNGARGQVELFNLPDSPAGTRMKATIQLDPGSGVAVEKLALQVRSKPAP
jgi:hypothetical protein